MIRQIQASSWILVWGMLLCGYRSGSIPARTEPNAGAGNDTPPVLTFQETAYTPASAEDRFYHYHLLVLTAIEESSRSLSESPAWAQRMLEDAAQYTRLLQEQISAPYGERLNEVITGLDKAAGDVGRVTITRMQRQQIKERVDTLHEILKTEYDPEKVRSWLSP